MRNSEWGIFDFGFGSVEEEEGEGVLDVGQMPALDGIDDVLNSALDPDFLVTEQPLSRPNLVPEVALIRIETGLRSIDEESVEAKRVSTPGHDAGSDGDG